jgi:general stress protein 26
MGLHAATIEMRSPELLRERLHELVKAARSVMVLSCGPGVRAGADGAPMELVRTDDDTTMYVATSLDAAHAEALHRRRLVTVVVPGEEYALFTAEAVVSRDRALIDSLWNDSWRRWFRGKSDPSTAIVILSPVEGSYWEAKERHSYVYRLLPTAASREPSDGVPVET